MFTITAREGEIQLNIFVLEDLILYIMVKVMGFDKRGEHEPKSVRLMFCSRKTPQINHDHKRHDSVRKKF